MKQELKSKIEAVLFVSGDEVTVGRLKRLFPDAEADEIEGAIAELQREYSARGVRIISKEGKVQMVTAPDYAGLVEDLVKSHLSEELTPAALETLACVAYREPITKEEIDGLRGVNSIISLRSLMMRGLVERAKDETYRVTLDFLKKLGVERINDLPRYDEFHTVPQDDN